LIDLETHEAVFTWMLQRLADAGLVKGKTVGIDATTLERTPRCAASCDATQGRAIKTFCICLAGRSPRFTVTFGDVTD